MRTRKVRRMLIAGVAAGLLTFSGAGTALAHTPPREEGEQQKCVYNHEEHHPGGEDSREAPNDGEAETAQDNECGEQ